MKWKNKKNAIWHSVNNKCTIFQYVIRGMKNIGIIFIVFIVTSCSNGMDMDKHVYGEKVQYNKGDVIAFPDFSIRVIGERQVEAPQYAQDSFIFEDFEVFSDDEKSMVSWSSGTGDIAPVIFMFHDKEFVLEKSVSDVFGRIQENEFVIWDKSTFDTTPKKQY